MAGASVRGSSNEIVLLSIAIVLAASGIGFALWRFRRPFVATIDGAPEVGFAGVLSHAYFVDEGIDAAVVQPLNGLSSVVLTNGIEVAVDRTLSRGGNLFTRLARLAGARLQDGDVGKYAWLVVAGALAVLSMLTLR